MRTIYSLLIIILILASCSKKKTNSLNKVLESNDTSILKEKKIELDKELQKLNKQINQLNEKLESLNPDKKDSINYDLSNRRRNIHPLSRVARKCKNQTKCTHLSRSVWFATKDFSRKRTAGSQKDSY